MSVVRKVPFPDPGGVARDLVVTEPPPPLLLLPDRDAPAEEFRAVAKATGIFTVRLLSFRALASTMRNIAKMSYDDGSMATAVSADGLSELGIFANVYITPAEGQPATAEEHDGRSRIGFAHGRDLHSLQVHVRVSVVDRAPADPVGLASAWLASLEEVQRFDRESDHPGR